MEIERAKRWLDTRMRRFYDGDRMGWNSDDAHAVRALLSRLRELEQLNATRLDALAKPRGGGA